MPTAAEVSGLARTRALVDTLRRDEAALAGYTRLFCGFFCLACGYSVAHAAAGVLTIWQLLAVRALVFLLALAPWAVRHGSELGGVNRPGLLLRGVFGTAMIGCMVYAVHALPLATATVLGKTTPLWSILLLWAFLAVAPQRAQLLAVPVAVLGIALLTHLGGAPPSHAVLLGMAVALTAGLLNALEFITLHRLRRTEGPATINFWYGGIMLLATGPLAATAPLPPTAHAWLLGLAFGVFSFAGQTLLAHAMGRVAPVAGGTGALSVPMFATAIGWLWFAERIGPQEILGAVLVVAASGAVIWLDTRRPDLSQSARFRWQR